MAAKCFVHFVEGGLVPIVGLCFGRHSRPEVISLTSSPEAAGSAEICSLTKLLSAAVDQQRA